MAQTYLQLRQEAGVQLVALDNPHSWSLELQALLQAGLPMLRAYQEHRERIDAARDANPDDLTLRINPRRNPWRSDREALVEEVDRRLADCSIMAWHCTRLCTDEAETIRRSGMHLLSPETFASRVRRRFEAGDISKAVSDRLLAKNQAHEPNRRGQLWFVLTRDLLATSGVDDLLGFWGGEALYNSHDRDVEIGPILATLGQPCIVEMAMPAGSIRTFRGLGITIVRVFELANGLQDENGAESEGHTRCPVGAGQVLRILMADDPAFLHLRGARKRKA